MNKNTTKRGLPRRLYAICIKTDVLHSVGLCSNYNSNYIGFCDECGMIHEYKINQLRDYKGNILLNKQKGNK